MRYSVHQRCFPSVDSFFLALHGETAYNQSGSWMYYGIGGRPRDWSLVIANSPGIIFGLTAAITARL